MDTIHVGILGAGRIAHTMARTLAAMEGVRLRGVASRDAERAKGVASRCPGAKAYASYEDMLADPDVHLVHVATPNGMHRLHATMCLEAGKHVLCEKAFTDNAAQAEEIIALARKKGLLLTEGLWTRYQPFARDIRGFIEGGMVGTPKGLTASLGLNVIHMQRIYDPALSGGALMNLGLYAVNFAFMNFGVDIASMSSSCVKHTTGVDAQMNIALAYADGRMASLYSSVVTGTDHRGVVFGDEGYMEVDNIDAPDVVRVYTPDRRLREVRYRPDAITGYEYELEAAARAIRAGAVECPEMPHEETIRLMRLLDTLRAEWNVPIPG